MIYVALGLAAGWVVTTVVFAGLLRSVLRAQARERDLLLNQLMHLSGKTWTPPPASAAPVLPDVDDGRYVTAPEQEPGL